MALKHLGFSIEEMRRMTMSDFIAITDLAFRDAPDETARGNGPREATQNDIDRLLG